MTIGLEIDIQQTNHLAQIMRVPLFEREARMEPTKVVARYIDGRVIKGFTQDFFPNKDSFHLFQYLQALIALVIKLLRSH